MPTALDIAQSALRRIGVLAAGETAAAEDASDAIAALARMFGAWEMDGIALGPLVDTALTTATEIPLPAPQLEAVEMNLAVRLAGPYGRTVDPATAALAERGWRMMQAAYAHVPVARQDDAVVVGSRGRGAITLADWQSGKI